jgi:hypothetical protein
VEFRQLDGKNATVIERPHELALRTAFLRTRLSRLRLWNSELNQPAPEVRAIMNARSLFKASCKQKEQLTKQQEEELREELSKFLKGTQEGVIHWLSRLFERTHEGAPEKLAGYKHELLNESEFLSFFAWRSALALDTRELNRLTGAVEAVKRIEAEEEQFHVVERLGDCFIGLCRELKRLPTKKELRKAFDPKEEIDPGRFSVLLKDALLNWLPDDHKAKGRRRE